MANAAPPGPPRPRVVPIAELTSAEQHFRCLPYAAVPTVAACVRRQLLHGSRVRLGAWGTPLPGASRGPYRRRNFGPAVATQIREHEFRRRSWEWMT